MDNRSISFFMQELERAFPEVSELRLPVENVEIREVWRAAASQLEMTQQEIGVRIGAVCNIPFDLSLGKVDPGLVAKVPYATALRSSVLPLKLEEGSVVIASPNPFDPNLLQDMQFILGTPVTAHLALPDVVESEIATLYAELGVRKLEVKNKAQNNKLSEREIPRLAAELMLRAITAKASDIHIQPVAGGDAVRMRIDGVLRRLVILPQAVADSVIRYFKAQSKMDPTNVNIPQDGRMSWEADERKFDLRVSTLPVAGHHEKLVIRILNRDSSVSLKESGMSLAEIHTLRRMASHPSGVILLCGPTGSGKTTTLYSVLSEVNEEGISIATVENPVEYQMSGLAQTEVNPEAGMTFAAALRSILRQDPDVILIGEIRDKETAQIAMQSAMTGHLVFSTLHTNAAVTAIPRLLDLGVPAPVLAEAITGIVSQRLLRRLCENCKAPLDKVIAPEDVHFERMTKVKPGSRAVGCKQCAFTGYRGRVVITEIIEINNKLSQLISEGVTSSEKLLAVCDATYVPIANAAVRRIISGDSSVAEAHRVLGKGFWLGLREEYGGDIPDLANMNISRAGSSANKPGLLLAGHSDSFTADFKREIEASWFTVHQAQTPEEADHLLHAHNEIEILLLDLPPTLSDEEIVDYVANYRKAVAWSRLPALLLLPEDRAQWQELLISHGATSRFMPRHSPVGSIAELIHAAMAEKADFRWGRENNISPEQEPGNT